MQLIIIENQNYILQVIWWHNLEDWDEKFIFEFNMAEARLELVGSTWMFIQ